MMWNTLRVYLDIFSGKRKPGPDDDYPRWDAFDRLADGALPRAAFGAGYVAFYAHFATEWWMYLFLPVHFLMGPVHGAIVNWCGHKYGYANFDNRDRSRNTFFADLLTMGELMQNNHHRFGKRVNFAVRWFEFDPTYPLIRALERFGVVRLNS